MEQASNRILTLNGGASSLKFALFTGKPALQRVLGGKLERIGLRDATMAIQQADGTSKIRALDAPDQASAVRAFVAELSSTPGRMAFDAVGHRIVHGGDRQRAPCVITPQVRADLQRLVPVDPEHMPFELALVDSIGRLWPDVVQVACFDTAFHRDLPRVAQLLPLPRRLFDVGVRRFGFHGLSYTFLLAELERLAGEKLARGRLVLAHLGSGTSLTAVVEGRSVDTTMAFTPASGLPMGTRCGDLDPGIASFLARSEGMDIARFTHMVNHESGLLGISGTSSDIRDLLSAESDDSRAAEAVALYVYEVRKRIGALAAAMGGLDGLVFSAGVGENSATVRARVCERLAFLGIELDPARNEVHAPLISKNGASVVVRVIRTDEERVIAQSVAGLLASATSAERRSR